MWIKLISFVVACALIGSSEHQKRSTVFTDESKKILDLFDFSNFDKQEALNCIERNRFDNLIRGKRSKWKIGKLCKSNVQFEDSKKLAEPSNVKNYPPESDEYPLQVKNEPKLLIRKAKENFSSLIFSKYDKTRRKRDEKFEAEYERGNKNSNIDGETRESEESHDESETIKSNGNIKNKRRRHWSKWSEWSACSVTCGKGRKIRFRRCIAKRCPTGELEMGEKACQLPACSLLKKIFNFL